jgi:hypothetical protein
MPRIPLIVCLLSLSLCCQAGGESVPVAAAAASAVPQVDWVSLRYEANKMGVTLSTTLDLAKSSRREMQAPPYSALGNAAFQTAAADVIRLGIHAHAETALDSYDTEGRIWFDPASGAVLQIDRLKPGPGGSRKIYRFAGDGVLRIRQEPAGRNEAAQSPASWTKIKQNFYPYAPVVAGCDVVTTPALLLYRASALDPADGGEPQCVFFDDVLYRVWLELKGDALRPVDYAVKAGGTTHKVSGNRRIQKVSLRVEPITPGADPAAFELLELRGAIAIYLDTASRLPVQITGERAGAGELVIGLVEAGLRD